MYNGYNLYDWVLNFINLWWYEINENGSSHPILTYDQVSIV